MFRGSERSFGAARESRDILLKGHSGQPVSHVTFLLKGHSGQPVRYIFAERSFGQRRKKFTHENRTLLTIQPAKGWPGPSNINLRIMSEILCLLTAGSKRHIAIFPSHSWVCCVAPMKNTIFFLKMCALDCILG